MAQIKRWSVVWDKKLKKYIPKTGPDDKGNYTISEARKKCKELNGE